MGYRRETLVLRAPGGNRVGFVVWERGERQGSLRCNLNGLPPEEEMRLLWLAEGSFALRDGGTVRADSAGLASQNILIAGNAPLVGIALTRSEGALYAHAYVQGASGEAAPGAERLQALAATLLEAQSTKEGRASGIREEDACVGREARRKAFPEEHVEEHVEAASPMLSGVKSESFSEQSSGASARSVSFTPGEPWPDALEPYRALFLRMHADTGTPMARVRAWMPEERERKSPRGLELERDTEREPARVSGLWCAPAWPPPPGLPGAVWREGCWTLPLARRDGM